MTECSTHSTKALDTEMQRHNSAYVVAGKLYAEINIPIWTKPQLKLICQKFRFVYKVQQNFTI